MCLADAKPPSALQRRLGAEQDIDRNRGGFPMRGGPSVTYAERHQMRNA
jgi:hypothetical protein